MAPADPSRSSSRACDRSADRDQPVRWGRTACGQLYADITLAALMDTSAFPLATRVGRAAGEYHRSAGDPAHALQFGLERILDGVPDLIDRAERAPQEPAVAP